MRWGADLLLSQQGSSLPLWPVTWALLCMLLHGQLSLALLLLLLLLCLAILQVQHHLQRRLQAVWQVAVAAQLSGSLQWR